LSKKTKTPLVGLTVALSTGLFAPHVLVPPTPGPLAAASNLQLENILLLIFMGGIIAFILIIVGGSYGNYLIKKNKYTFEEGDEDQSKNEKISDVPGFNLAILPILFPIILMGAGTLIKFLPPDFIIIDLLNLITQPTFALGIGMLFAFRLFINNNKTNIHKSIKKGFIQAAPILIITGMGGSLGSIIQTIPLYDFAKDISSYQSLGILIPFGIAALLKTAQGSSTVAIITTSSIVFPLLPLLNLDSEIGKVWVIMSLGVGSMTVSHANDSYFWIVSQMSGMDVKTAYKTHTMGTLLQGVVGFIIVFTGYSLWRVF
jgi:GntP family gluconate:H+ symporter